MKPLVSVILPVYNVADYVCAAIDALLAQTVDAELECILVSDHGSDDSMERAFRHVAQRLGLQPTDGSDWQQAGTVYGKGCAFAFLATPQNGGPGVARNVGIDAAHGEYVAFMDSDDIVDPTMMARLTAAADGAGADIAYCQFRYKGGPRDGKTDGNPVLPDGTLSDDDRRRFLVTMKTFCWTFIYRRTFLQQHGLRFPANRSSEDTNFLIRVLLYAQSVACVDAPLYVYCVRTASLTMTPNPQRCLDKMAALSRMMEQIRIASQTDGLADRYADELEFVYLKKGFAVGMLNYLVSTREVQRPTVDALRGALSAEFPQWRNNGYLRQRFKYRCLVHLLYRAPMWLLGMIGSAGRRLGLRL